MARLSICKNCGKKLQPHEKHMHSSKAYCEECYKKIAKESGEYKQLVEFICCNYGIEKPTGLMLKQIKEMKTVYGWSYAAMAYTLWYCKEILGKQLLEKYGVALIRHFYEEAGDYYLQQEKLKEQVEVLSREGITTKTVKIENKKQSGIKPLLVDLENLLEGGGNY